MSAQLKLASDIPKTRDASGDVNGTIGEHIFKTNTGKWSVHDDTVEVYLIDKHDDGSVEEEVFIQFSSDVEHNKELKLQTQRSPLAWVSFKAFNPPRVIQCIEATLFIETLSLSPFEVKGQLRGTTDEADHPVDISFHLKQ
ncbi:hypothetical protein [Pseudomonas sp. ICMP 460]|uniref:hypothetical protein n=1 Tax=Pseudomonas sp. ICMP 460 TaxID=1718917 RepID=UPI000C07B57F|nr:hypothetical protein [Pseudomonas sp. ICMP 460]PHN26099.1 hypothetical protein AO240_12055 [Pseudomonas sp. ICMP 460]